VAEEPAEVEGRAVGEKRAAGQHALLQEEDEEDETPKRRTKKPKAQKHYGTGLSGFPELWNRKGAEVTLRIDSNLLAAAESEDPKATRKEAAEELRKIVSTVGKPGEAGEHIRCVVSVNMLSEGWDASNVTHILGLRAFQSQLLCEQVVGRALRRMSYAANGEGKFEPEYAEVYGVPFSFIPCSGATTDPKPGPMPTRVRALENRSACEITFPRLQGYRYDIAGERLNVSFTKDSKLALSTLDIPTKVQLDPIVGESSIHTLDDLKHRRLNEVAFLLAKLTLERSRTLIAQKLISQEDFDNLQTRVDAASDGSGIVRAKVWKKGAPEPEAWTGQVSLKHVNASGCPGLFGFSPQAQRVFIDNVAVTPN